MSDDTPGKRTASDWIADIAIVIGVCGITSLITWITFG